MPMPRSEQPEETTQSSSANLLQQFKIFAMLCSSAAGQSLITNLILANVATKELAAEHANTAVLMQAIAVGVFMFCVSKCCGRTDHLTSIITGFTSAVLTAYAARQGLAYANLTSEEPNTCLASDLYDESAFTFN